MQAKSELFQQIVTITIIFGSIILNNDVFHDRNERFAGFWQGTMTVSIHLELQNENTSNTILLSFTWRFNPYIQWLKYGHQTIG